ncbi:adenylate/guanylate cyclase domain-containing protein [Streptosporangium sp. NBC_01755]|uniref:adenylate/guanylate cyclase domain-containing protein n=1 Tax=unclassified Streptosporangium TaxID=2632669 RepID=UPI002DDC4B93|nr:MULTISPECIES: adenylate/guanylate cyclase domain-containing protein [unclassified Streptosporangium]WSA24196.1 adenylate/guanylate cyclase domain-containing protein [Streptosporangium sp. NBC_01810]WSC97728.1 adenylate/guanylate cyclase domain-containing protein [Streptosporangium sp. NBC_01755]
MGGEEVFTGRPTAEQIEHLFVGTSPRYTRIQVASLARLPQELTERIWRALGFATLSDDAVAFTDADVAALEQVRTMMESGLLDDRTVIKMARALGQTTARLAHWQAEIIVSALLDPGRRPTDEDLAGVMETSRRLLPGFERVLIHVWRAQLAAAGTRLLTIADITDEIVPTRLTLTVGFADLVSFTRVSRELDERGLAELVEGFETRASDVVAGHGGRLVKTLGDEVLFTAADPRAAALIALDLVSAIRRYGPDVRIGLAYGPVLPIMGDVFGTTVNLAARLTAIARPGTIVVDSELAEALEGAPGVEVGRIRRRPARGLGVVQPYVLRRAGND